MFKSNVKPEEDNHLNLIIADLAYLKTVECLTEAIELNPNNYLAYEARGYFFNLSSLGRYKEAIEDFKNAIRLHHSAKNYFYCGTAYLSMERIEQAQADFEKAVSLNPNYSEPYGELAHYLCNFRTTSKSYRFCKQGFNF